MANITITGFRIRASKVRADKYLRDLTGLPLNIVKTKIDAVLQGESAQFEVPDSQSPHEVVAHLSALGFIAVVVE